MNSYIHVLLTIQIPTSHKIKVSYTWTFNVHQHKIFKMILDIFSSFDPFSFNSTIPSTTLFLYTNLLAIILIQSIFWTRSSRKIALLSPIFSLIFIQLTRTFIYNLKGIRSLVTPLFIIIISINLIGLIPYTFSLSSHLIFTLRFGLPLWLSIIISRFSKNIKASIAHFLPDGAPDWLNPFLVLIETTSIIVRPITLSFRLAANIRAGHIVLRLVGVYCATAWFNSIRATFILLATTLGYILFEIAICIIQAYIFCLLLSLYADDHAH